MKSSVVRTAQRQLMKLDETEENIERMISERMISERMISYRTKYKRIFAATRRSRVVAEGVSHRVIEYSRCVGRSRP